MKLTINYVKNAGNASEEVVGLKVLEDCDLAHYAVFDSTYTSDGKLSNKVRHVHWFAPKLVKKGDYVQLYTMTGTDTSATNTGNTKTHKVYWGLNVAVWNDDGDYIALVHTPTWETKKVKDARK